MAKPTESELEILQVLWAHGPSTVRFVNEHLNEKSTKAIGYTTSLKFMQLMLEKGMLSRDTSSRTHVYKAEVKESAIQKTMLNQLVDRMFKGSSTQLVLQALGNTDTSDEELAKIKALIEEKEKEQKHK